MNLNQVTLPTVDLPRAVAFYRTLGLRQIVASPHYARFECPQGEATFSLHVVDEMPATTAAIIYFECAKLDERYRSLCDAGVEFDQPPTDQRWLWREARLSDPDGNPLCLFHAGQNRRHPPWRIEQ